MPSEKTDSKRLLPSLYSLRGRFFYAVVTLALLVGTCAVYGWTYVANLSQQHIGKIEERAAATDAVDDIVQQVHAIEIDLQRYIILPNDPNKTRIQHATPTLKGSLLQLKSLNWITRQPLLKALSEDLSLTGKRLHSEIDHLIEVRADKVQWIPAMKIMQEEMLLHNSAFNDAVNLALNELPVLRHRDDVYYEMKDRFTNIRYLWQRLISEFRLFISNRMDIYPGTPESGMRARASNIETYLTQAQEQILAAQDLVRNHGLDFELDMALEHILSAKVKWEAGYRRVNYALTSEHWRTDIVLLNDAIGPLLLRLHEQLSTLGLELSVATAQDITDLTRIAKRLSDFVVLLAAAVVVFILVAYGFFNRALLRPIADVTRALKHVANGREGAEVPVSQLDEISDLTAAFCEMQQQVRIRETHLDYLAHHDPLTGLPNRTLFRDRLQQAMLHAHRESSLVGLMFLDLDNFKSINDTLGHEAGDHLLIQVAERLKGCLRDTDTMARLGGDEFAIIACELKTVDDIEAIAIKICTSCNSPYRLDDGLYKVTYSMGITLYPNDESNIDLLIKNADIAMYHAKDWGRNCYKFFSQEMSTQIMDRMVVEALLRRALENHEFDVFFQPIVAIDSKEIVSAEALLRWRHPEHGLVSAGKYISILEKTGLIESVTLWVLQQALHCHRACLKATGRELKISVNLSGKLLSNRPFTKQMLSLLEKEDFDPTFLIIEITEDTLLQDMEASSSMLRMLSGMGMQIAMDDFGTRQSSLRHLRHNPIDIVKIDKEFVLNTPHDEEDNQLVAAIISMAHSLKKKVVAEGVEKPEQLALLHSMHCDFMQGFLFSPAVPVAELITLLRRLSESTVEDDALIDLPLTETETE